ncbi:class III lanthionine synthetase LanKC [Kitasatospora sp. GP82]|uniref:class III lanthionine synthetase LanKC n=1 Tax=Kitasatospora sp. GP82 TaxID=3035089 RepID=UPI002476F8F0|nr:class III lanthionine synthetase LanKC [Kitasatospora sp. GP82]
MRYEAYSYADPLFYDSPVRWASHDEFAAVAESLPLGWVSQDRDVWVTVQPADVQLPDQGWKVHVSACLDNAEQVLDAVRAYCLREGVPFKYLRGLPILQVQNAKYAARGSSGKFCTLYPLDEHGLERCLQELGSELSGQPGPYILSDLRWKDGPLYLRYGAFLERWCRSETGEQVLALATPDGRLVPDVRAAVFEVPDWAPVPDFLRPVLDSRRSGGGTLPYQVERALHFSNAGGIYLARDRADGTRVVLKEARPHAGLDQRGTDAVSRLRHEHDILTRLAGVPAVPVLHGQLTAWEHQFLIQEYVEGTTLNEWLAHNYPLVHPDPDESAIAEYTRRALDILGQVERGLAQIHARGVVFGDLHPRNLMLRPDGSVVFIDFELASPTAEFVRPALGAAGFAAPSGATGTELDHHALAALRLWLLLPLQQLLALDPGKTDELVDAVERRFPLPADYGEPIRARLARPAQPPRPGQEEIGARRAELTELLTAESPDWKAIRDSLAAGIAATATPERLDRLFPGDVAQFTQDSLGLAYGAAGVLYALDATGCHLDPAHLDWLTEAARRSPARPGLYTGGHGTAYVLDLLGARAAALDLLDRLSTVPARPPGTVPAQRSASSPVHRSGTAPTQPLGADLAGGKAGIALALLHFAEAADPALLERAVEFAEVAADALTGRDPGAATATPTPGPAKPGLMHGASGAALALLRLYEHTGDSRLLDRAEAALAHDLERCVSAGDGTVQVHDGLRVLPYLEGGSAGIGLVLDQLLTHRPDSPLSVHGPALVRAAEPEFIIQPGLFNGRAGLLGYLGRLRNAPDRDRCADRADRHRRLLSWHQVSYRGHLAFPGDQLLRLSSDLATGSAGVLLALGTVLAGTPFLPWTAPASRPRTAPPSATDLPTP